MTFAEVASLKAKLGAAERLADKGDLAASIATLHAALHQIGSRYVDPHGTDDTGTKQLLAEQNEAAKAYSPAFHLLRNVLESRIALAERRLPTSFEFWTHGGEPGTISRQLVVKRRSDGAFIASVREAGRSFDSTPSRAIDEVTELALPTREASSFLDEIIVSRVFAPQRSVDRSREVADASIEDWTLTSSDGALKARFTSPFPDELKSARAACVALMERIKKRRR